MGETRGRRPYGRRTGVKTNCAEVACVPRLFEMSRGYLKVYLGYLQGEGYDQRFVLDRVVWDPNDRGSSGYEESWNRFSVFAETSDSCSFVTTCTGWWVESKYPLLLHAPQLTGLRVSIPSLEATSGCHPHTQILSSFLNDCAQYFLEKLRSM